MKNTSKELTVTHLCLAYPLIDTGKLFDDGHSPAGTGIDKEKK